MQGWRAPAHRYAARSVNSDIGAARLFRAGKHALVAVNVFQIMANNCCVVRTAPPCCYIWRRRMTRVALMGIANEKAHVGKNRTMKSIAAAQTLHSLA